jgi:hypothetical protein
VVNVNVQAGEVNVLWISFIVFNLNNGQFAAYGGYTSIASNQTQTVDLLKGFSAGQNAFYGFSAFQPDISLNYVAIKGQASIDSNFLLSYTSMAGSFVVSYLFIGFPGNFTCLACQSISQNYYLNGNCVSRCPDNTVAVTLSNGGQFCRPCPAGTGLIVVRGSCVCPDSYSMQNDKCVLTLSSL